MSVVCLSYNHEKFVAEAIASVIGQTYGNIQIIAVDDASTDATASVVRSIAQKHPSIEFIQLERNVGNCTAFNAGLARARGKYIIDFATDDVMMPDRIEQQVEFFEKLDRSYGVVFSDAIYIDASGRPLRYHFRYLMKRKLLDRIPEGDIYASVLSTFFIPSPTMIVKAEVFNYLGGYDENLAYEDFDFWVRSSRKYKYAYMNSVTTRIRVLPSSLSRGAYRKGDRQAHSTYLVCKKAARMNQSPSEDQALAVRIRYEIRQCVLTGNQHEAGLFLALLREIGYADLFSQTLVAIGRLKLPLAPLRKLYQKIRFG